MRKKQLLNAVLKLLNNQKNSSYVVDILSSEVEYDGAVCDGYCLYDDIEIELKHGLEYNVYDVQCAESGSQWFVKALSENHAKKQIVGIEEYDYDEQSEFYIHLAFDSSDSNKVYFNEF